MKVFVKLVSILVMSIIPIFAVKQAHATGILYYREPPKIIEQETMKEKISNVVVRKSEVTKLGSLATQIRLREDATLAMDLAEIIKTAKFDEMPIEKKKAIITLLGKNNENLLAVMKS